MKIQLIHAMTGATPEFIRYETGVLDRYKSAGTELRISKIRRGSSSIESHFDEYLGAVDTFRLVRQAEEDGFDAVIITCFANANVEPSREIARIPVIGSGMAAMSYAALLGHRFSLIMASESSAYRHRHEAMKLGLEDKFASVRRSKFRVLDLLEDRRATLESFLGAAREAIEEDGADVIIPACFGMTGIAREAQEILGVPVIDPAGAAITMAESLIRMGLSQSKRAYPLPPEKERSIDIEPSREPA